MSWSVWGVAEETWRQGGNGAANGRVGSRVSDLVSDKRNNFRVSQWGYWKVRQNQESCWKSLLSGRDRSRVNPQEMAACKNDTESWLVGVQMSFPFGEEGRENMSLIVLGKGGQAIFLLTSQKSLRGLTAWLTARNSTAEVFRVSKPH